MRLEKEYIIEHPRATVWQFILNPNLLAEILPGCKSLTSLGNDQYIANIEIKIGPVQGQYSTNLQIFDKTPPEGYRFKVSGVGSKGHIAGMGEIRLQETNGTTILNFAAEGNVGGILARVGQRLILAAGKKLIDQGFEDFKKRLTVEYA